MACWLLASGFCLLPAQAGQFARLLGGGATVSSNLPAPALWLIADDNAAGGNGTRLTWPDSSGFGRDMAVWDTNSPPLLVTNVLNGHAVMRFNGTDQIMDTPVFDVGATGRTTILVVFVRRSLSTTSEGDYAFQYEPGVDDLYMASDNYDGGAGFNPHLAWGLTEATDVVQATNVCYVALQRADGVGYYNSDLQGPVTPDWSATDATDKSLRIPGMRGASLPAENDYAEIIVWDVLLTNQQMAWARAYAKNRHDP